MEKNCLNAAFSKEAGKLVLLDNTADGCQVIEGTVYINHDTRIIRLYNFDKTELCNKDKVNIIYSILEGTTLYPLDKKFKKSYSYDIENYALLVNAHSLDGNYIDTTRGAKSLTTELIDNTETYNGEPETISRIRKTIKAAFKSFMEQHGMQELVIDTDYDDLILGYKEISNMAKLLKAYFRGKGFCINMVIENKWLSNNKAIHILPLFKR